LCILQGMMWQKNINSFPTDVSQDESSRTFRPLDDASLERCVPCTMRTFDDPGYMACEAKSLCILVSGENPGFRE
jgi:hypothetical protein